MKTETPMETWFHCLPNFAFAYRDSVDRISFSMFFCSVKSPVQKTSDLLSSCITQTQWVEGNWSRWMARQPDEVPVSKSWLFWLLFWDLHKMNMPCISDVGIIGICPFTVGKKNINLHGRGNLGFGLIFRGRVSLQGAYLGCNPWNTIPAQNSLGLAHNLYYPPQVSRIVHLKIGIFPKEKPEILNLESMIFRVTWGG